MKLMIATVSVLALSASPALAQEKAPAEKPQMCEMMHDGKKMKGMMKKGEDGKMSCQMMDHSKMQHDQSEHGKKKAAAPEKPEGSGHQHD